MLHLHNALNGIAAMQKLHKLDACLFTLLQAKPAVRAF